MITGTARPLTGVQSLDGKPDWTTIKALVSEWKPDALVVGIPYHMDGNRQPLTDAAERFCRQLEGRFGLPVHRAEERLSSQTAYELSDGGHDSLDALAARVILEGWMNTRPVQS